MTRSNLLKTEQVWLLLDEYGGAISNFGSNFLGDESLWVMSPKGNKAKKLPVCKLGFLDRKIVCMDGCDTFLDLETGNKQPVADLMPMETITYNLTAVFTRYHAQAHKQSSSAEQNGESNVRRFRSRSPGA